MEVQLDNIVSFAILMQDIKTKSPGYILEKFKTLIGNPIPHGWLSLDYPYKQLYQEWKDRWGYVDSEFDSYWGRARSVSTPSPCRPRQVGIF